ncbi:MAG: efflux RND transporter periplasmic adaptor subunit [Planctomycetota bacterium]
MTRSHRWKRGIVLTACMLIVVAWAHVARGQQAGLDEMDRWSKVVFKPKRHAVLSAQVNSVVVRIDKRFGDSFETGCLVIELDDTVYDVAVKQAEAAVASARAHLACEEKICRERLRRRKTDAITAAAQSNLEATESMRRDNNASGVELAQARRDYEVARVEAAEVAAAETPRLEAARHDVAVTEGNLRVARRNLEAVRVEAPFGGRVVSIEVNEHEAVRKGTPLVHLIDDRTLVASFLLPEALFHKARVGRTVSVSADLLEAQKLTATITHVAATVDPGSRTFEVRAEVDNRDGRLRAGMGGRIPLDQFVQDKP